MEKFVLSLFTKNFNKITTKSTLYESVIKQQIKSIVFNTKICSFFTKYLHDGHTWCKVKMTTSRMILALLFKELRAWTICNVEMMFMISFLITNVKSKQLGVAMLFTTLKDIILLSVHLFTKIVLAPPLCEYVCSLHLLHYAQVGEFDSSIHLNMHDHLMVEGCSRETIKQVTSLVDEEVSCTPWATLSAIALVASKTFSFWALVKRRWRRTKGSCAK
jgi:hypothetical protein